MSDKSSCKCHICQGACRRKPGWYKPGEIEKSAELLGLTTKEFFDQYVMVDYWCSDEENKEPVFVLSPAFAGSGGGMAPFDPKGACSLFKDGNCKIHGAKPFECSEYIHTCTMEEVGVAHKSCMEAWRDHQGQIEELLGRKPAVPDISFADILSILS